MTQPIHRGQCHAGSGSPLSSVCSVDEFKSVATLIEYVRSRTTLQPLAASARWLGSRLQFCAIQVSTAQDHKSSQDGVLMELACAHDFHEPGHRNAHISRVASDKKECHMSHGRRIGDSNVDKRSRTELFIRRSGGQQLRDECSWRRVSGTLGISSRQAPSTHSRRTVTHATDGAGVAALGWGLETSTARIVSRTTSAPTLTTPPAARGEQLPMGCSFISLSATVLTI